MYKRSSAVITGIFALAFSISPALLGQVNVFTFHNDLARTGANLNETILTTSTVSSGFGKLFSHKVDGYVYAQPLYGAGVPISGLGRHNVVFVATEGDSLYAFDADNITGTNANPLWHTTFVNGTNVVPIPTSTTGGEDDDFGCLAINPEVGITSTPVIDPVNMTLYAVAATKETSGASVNYVYRVHAVDITTGIERPGSGTIVSGPPAGAFNGQYMVQRTGLLLLSGKIYIGFASSCDHQPYNGFLATFDSATLKQTSAMFVSAAGYGGEGGIWGGAPAVDSTGNIYIGIGNGTFDASTSFGCSLVKLNAQLQLSDYFTPADVNSTLNPNDFDLGASMPIILPDSAGLPGHPHLMAIGGKEGYLYLVDRDDLEHWEPLNNTLLPVPPRYVGGKLMGRNVYYNGAVIASPSYSKIQSFSVANSLALTASTSATYGPWLGASLSISANGSTNGILWVQSANGDGYSGGSNAVLEAYNATLLGAPLYSSLNSAPDSLGLGIRWSVPTIAQGKVYAGAAADSISGTIGAYGIASPTCATDVSSEVTVARGGWKFNHATGSYSETVTLTNKGNSPVGPVTLVYDAVSTFATVTSASGTTTCGALTGSFYQSPAGTAMLNPGQNVQVYLTATSSSTQTIEFNTRVLAGNGIR